MRRVCYALVEFELGRLAFEGLSTQKRKIELITCCVKDDVDFELCAVSKTHHGAIKTRDTGMRLNASGLQRGDKIE